MHPTADTPASSRLYCDNAATSFPKPPEVLQAMVNYATHIGASAGRGAYAEAQASAEVLRTCRQRLNTLFNGENPDHFIFTLNCTDALNLAIQGLLKPGDHAITTWMDHNSVLRPYHHLAADRGISYTHVPVDPVTCLVDPADIRKAMRPETRLIACVHGSNVTGTLQPIREIGAVAREAGIPFLVDAAQSAGHVPIDVRADYIDLLAFPGHKGLLGPLGTGALYIRPGFEKRLRPLRFGGTGSISEQAVQPDFMPDKFEAGSHNAIGIAGLSEGVQWILKRGIKSLFEHDQALCRAFIDELHAADNIRFLGPQGTRHRTSVFSVIIERGIERPADAVSGISGIARPTDAREGSMDPRKLADLLEKDFGILTRPGLHCAPLAHTHLNTVNTGGTTRLSFGPYLTPADVKYAAQSLTKIATESCAMLSGAK